MTITTSTTIRKDTFNAIYTYLNTNLSDPLNRNKQWLFASFPDVQANNFTGYPFIVIAPLDFSAYKTTLDFYGYTYSTTLTIVVYSTSARSCAELADSIHEKLFLTKNAISNISFDALNSSSSQTQVAGKNRHFTVLNYNMEVKVCLK